MAMRFTKSEWALFSNRESPNKMVVDKKKVEKARKHRKAVKKQKAAQRRGK